LPDVKLNEILSELSIYHRSFQLQEHYLQGGTSLSSSFRHRGAIRGGHLHKRSHRRSAHTDHHSGRAAITSDARFKSRNIEQRMVGNTHTKGEPRV